MYLAFMHAVDFRMVVVISLVSEKGNDGSLHIAKKLSIKRPYLLNANGHFVLRHSCTLLGRF